jgi:hypothetical protein
MRIIFCHEGAKARSFFNLAIPIAIGIERFLNSNVRHTAVCVYKKTFAAL